MSHTPGFNARYEVMLSIGWPLDLGGAPLRSDARLVLRDPTDIRRRSGGLTGDVWPLHRTAFWLKGGRQWMLLYQIDVLCVYSVLIYCMCTVYWYTVCVQCTDVLCVCIFTLWFSSTLLSGAKSQKRDVFWLVLWRMSKNPCISWKWNESFYEDKDKQLTRGGNLNGMVFVSVGCRRR